MFIHLCFCCHVNRWTRRICQINFEFFGCMIYWKEWARVCIGWDHCLLSVKPIRGDQTVCRICYWKDCRQIKHWCCCLCGVASWKNKLKRSLRSSHRFMSTSFHSYRSAATSYKTMCLCLCIKNKLTESCFIWDYWFITTLRPYCSFTDTWMSNRNSTSCVIIIGVPLSMCALTWWGLRIKCYFKHVSERGYI